MAHTSMEEMALAVLKGDMNAARQLADLLVNEYAEGRERLPPISCFKVDGDKSKLRVVMFPKEDVQWPTGQDREDFQQMIEDWLEGKIGRRVLGLNGIERIEIFDLS